MPLPQDWNRMPDNVIRQSLAPADSIIGADKIMPLLMLGRERNNFFMSFRTRYEKTGADGINNQNKLNQVLYNTYKNLSKHMEAGAKVDSATHEEKISGILFNVFDMSIHVHGLLFIHTLVFNGLVNGAVLTAVIQTNNELNNKTLMQAWQRSVFANLL